MNVCVIWYEMWCRQQTDNSFLMIVVLVQSKVSRRNFKLCLCVHACVHIALFASLITATLHQLINYFWMCDVYIKLLYHEVKHCCLNFITKLTAHSPYITHLFESELHNVNIFNNHFSVAVTHWDIIFRGILSYLYINVLLL